MGRRYDFLNINVQGLATAFTLQRAGHSVIVLEKLNKKAMVCIRLLLFILLAWCSHKLIEFRRGWSYQVGIHKDDTLILFARVCRAPPNMTRLLHRWGLGPVLSKKSVKCERLLCIDGSSYFLSTRLISNMTFRSFRIRRYVEYYLE